MKTIYALLLSLLTLPALAQHDSYGIIVATLEEEYSTQSVNLSKEAFTLLGYFDITLKDEVLSLVDGIDRMKIIIHGADDKPGFPSRAAELFINNNYTEADISKYDQIHGLRLFIDTNLTSIGEAHFVSDKADGIIISFFGRFKYHDIKKLLKSANKIGSIQ